MQRIFLTVGGQLHFDRLVRLVDEWALEHPQVEIFAQIGKAEYRPENFDSVPLLEPAQFRSELAKATTIVAHAGMGTILTGLELRKAILLFPRLARLREHRTDHQIDTARYFANEGLVRVAFDRDELYRELSTLESWTRPAAIADRASDELVDRIRRFVLAR